MRRSKKHPEYDPNELADLIETPAVGKGVGSHLLSSYSEVTTVVESVPDTVITFPAPVPTVADLQATTVDPSELSSVDTDEPSPVDTSVEAVSETPSIVTSIVSPVDITEVTPIVSPAPSTVVTSQNHRLGRLWISESGEVVPESRVRRIAAAMDALSSGEETLYSLLWKSPALGSTVESRSVQAGYDFLSKSTGFSRKTIQRTIDRLIAKHYIEIETPADIYRRAPTVYRVFGAAAILARLARHHCTHVAKIGPGVAFVAPLAPDRPVS